MEKITPERPPKRKLETTGDNEDHSPPKVLMENRSNNDSNISRSKIPVAVTPKPNKVSHIPTSLNEAMDLEKENNPKEKQIVPIKHSPLVSNNNVELGKENECSNTSSDVISKTEIEQNEDAELENKTSTNISKMVISDEVSPNLNLEENTEIENKEENDTKLTSNSLNETSNNKSPEVEVELEIKKVANRRRSTIGKNRKSCGGRRSLYSIMPSLSLKGTYE